MRTLKLGLCVVAVVGSAIFLWAVRSAAAGRYRPARDTISDGTSHAKEPMDQATGPADLALINGVIYTGDSKQPRVEALAARGETIIATGTTAEIRKLMGASTQVIDLHGGFAMPGFNDAHLHLGSGGQAKLAVDLEGAKSIGEVQQRVRARVAITKPGEWVTGSGWDHTLWNPPNFPTRQDLDAISGDHPMFFSHISGHVGVANSKALELAGITASTPNPSGGKIEHDGKGEPDGMLEEDSAMSLVTRKIPAATPAQRRHGIELAMQEATANGLTSIQDYSSWNDFLTYRELKQEGKLTVRVTEWLTFELPLAQLEEMRREGGTADPWLKTGALKGFMDGALGSTTAALLAPYSDDPKSSGILRVKPAELNRMSIERDRAGFQLAFHAIGDRANRVALDAFAAVLAANGPRDRRDRIEHAQIVAPEDFARYASLHVVASMQPSHQTTDMRWAERRLGPERIKGAYAWHTMLSLGVPLAFGTDYPVEVINPMRGLHACVTRELPEGGPAGGWQPQEKISMAECIHAYTSGAAYAEFEEAKKGRLVPGQFADIVVLSDDVTKAPSAGLFRVHVLRTIAGGRTVYEASSSSVHN
jgi:predicted amidohydrolase YtcJ